MTIVESSGIKNILSALGTGVGVIFDINNLRYHKIVSLMDSDSDGLVCM